MEVANVATSFLRSRKEAEDAKVHEVVTQELKSSGIEDIRPESEAFEGSAEDRLQKLQDTTSSLNDYFAQANLTSQDFVELDKCVGEINRRVTEIEIIDAGFRAQVMVQYPHVPFSQKFAVLILGLFRGLVREATILQVFGGNAQKRKALLHVADTLMGIAQQVNSAITKLAGKYEESKKERELLPVRNRQREILARTDEYKKLLDLRDEKRRDRKSADLLAYWNKEANLAEAITILSEKIERMEIAALEQAQLELAENSQ